LAIKITQVQFISANLDSKLELTVEGTLDKQEKKEIKKVLKTLFKMVKDFVTGKANINENNKFANLTTISRIKAEFDINNSIGIAAQSSAKYVAQTPIHERPAIHKAQTINPQVISGHMDKLTDRMFKAVKDSDLDPSKILKQLNKRLSKLSRKFMNDKPGDWDMMRLRREILEDFVRKLKKLTSENETEINGKEQIDAGKAANPNEPAIGETTALVSNTILNVASQDFHFEVEYSVADDN
jgi:hypothetical protein